MWENYYYNTAVSIQFVAHKYETNITECSCVYVRFGRFFSYLPEHNIRLIYADTNRSLTQVVTDDKRNSQRVQNYVPIILFGLWCNQNCMKRARSKTFSSKKVVLLYSWKVALLFSTKVLFSYNYNYFSQLYTILTRTIDNFVLYLNAMVVRKRKRNVT